MPKRGTAAMNEHLVSLTLDLEDELNHAKCAAELASTAIESVNNLVPEHVMFAVYEADRRIIALHKMYHELVQLSHAIGAA